MGTAGAGRAAGPYPSLQVAPRDVAVVPRVARRGKQVAKRALRRFEGDAQPLDRAGIFAPSAFDTTRVRCMVLSLWRRRTFHCIHRSGNAPAGSALGFLIHAVDGGNGLHLFRLQRPVDQPNDAVHCSSS